MINALFIQALFLTLLASSVSSINKLASCNASEGRCTSEASPPLSDGDALSFVQLRASLQISPEALNKFCPHKCIIKNVKSGRRLFAQVDLSGNDGIGATADGPTSEDQMWFFDAVADNQYTLKNAASSRRLYAQAGQGEFGGIGALEFLPIYDDQKWYVEGLGDGTFSLKDSYSSRRLFAQVGKDGKDGVGASNSFGVQEDQQWYIVPVETSFAEPFAKTDGRQAWAVPLKWSYTPSPAHEPVEPYGPNNWSLVEDAAACAEEGTQSPIDLRLELAVKSSHETASDLDLLTVGNCETPTYMLNEHTAELEYSSQDCSKALKVTWLGHEYFLARVLYHSPSEHTWDGGYFPMEVHHVHKDAGNLALVIAVMVAVAYSPEGVDSGPAAFLLDVMSKFPHPRNDKANNRFEIGKSSDKWNPYRDFIPNLSEGFFVYSGSLTTPPCTSGTIWIMAPTSVKVPGSTLKMYRELINENPVNQLAPFGTIVGDDVSKLPSWSPESHMSDWSYDLKCNNRPIQPLVGVNNQARVITLVLPQDKTLVG